MSSWSLPPLANAVIAAAAIACGACSVDGPLVIVHVQARPAVTALTELTVELRNDNATQSETFAVTGRNFPLSFSVQASGRSGQLELQLSGAGGDGTIRATASATVALATDQLDADVLLEPTDFVVNTTYVGSQDLAFRFDGGGRQLSASAAGLFTIGWSDTCQMVGRCDVFGRRFDATGTAASTVIAAGTTQFNINQSSGMTGFEPSLVTDRTGNTLAAWATGGTLLAVVVSATGDHVTATETAVTTATSPGTPAVTVLPDGRFVVAWTDAAPTSGTVVKARYLSAVGLPVNNPITNTSDAFTVSTTSHLTDEAPAIVALDNGQALAFAWRDDVTMRGRFYSATGAALTTTDIVLATHPATEDIGPPQLASLGGDAVLLYRRATIGGDADNGQLLLSRRSPSGTAQGVATVVTDDCELGPAALAIQDQRVGVAWAACTVDTDGDGCGIRFRQSRDGLATLAAPVTVNSTTIHDQEDPSFAYLPDHSIAATWSDTSAVDPDRDGSAVRARIVYPD